MQVNDQAHDDGKAVNIAISLPSLTLMADELTEDIKYDKQKDKFDVCIQMPTLIVGTKS